MEQIEKKLNEFKQAVKNGLLNGTIEYTKKYRYNELTPYIDWFDILFTIDKTEILFSVGKYKEDVLCTKAGTLILSIHNDILKDIFTKEEEQQFCEMVDKKPMEQQEVDEEIEYYE